MSIETQKIVQKYFIAIFLSFQHIKVYNSTKLQKKWVFSEEKVILSKNFMEHINKST